MLEVASDLGYRVYVDAEMDKRMEKRTKVEEEGNVEDWFVYFLNGKRGRNVNSSRFSFVFLL